MALPPGMTVAGNKQATIRILYPFVAFFVVLFVLTARNPFFSDKDILFSKIAFWLMDNGFSFILPDAIDPGYPPLLAYLLALIWQTTGKELFMSHLAILPFTIGLVWQSLKFLRRYLPEQYLSAAMLIVLADPNLLAQATLFSTDLVMLFFLLLAVNAVLDRKKHTLALAVFGLLFSHMRGVPFVLAVLIFDIYKNVGERRIMNFLKLSVPYMPAATLWALWIIYHHLTKGWTGYHPNSPWISCFETVDLMGFFRNLLILFWRLLDNGRIFLWMAGAYFIVLFIKKRIRPDRPMKDLLILLSLCFLASVPSMLIYKMLNGHRYLIAVYFFFSVLVSYLVFTGLKQEKIKKILTAIFVTGLVTGNFWVYPDKIAKGWDSSLAYLPYHHLRKEMIHYIESQFIPVEYVGTGIPNTAVFRYIDASEDTRSFKLADLENDTYIFYSNIFNMFSDEDIDRLKNNWVRIQQYKIMQVYVALYRNPE